jgi:O-antigen ligase
MIPAVICTLLGLALTYVVLGTALALATLHEARPPLRRVLALCMVAVATIFDGTALAGLVWLVGRR